MRVQEFFLARQPILDRTQSLVAYELLFRSAPVGPANISSDVSATASVIEHASQLGIEKVIGEASGYINVDTAVLMSDIFTVLPRERIVLEIIESTQPTPELLRRIAALSKQGFRFALDDVVNDDENVRLFLPLIDIIKVDLQDVSNADLFSLTARLASSGKHLLAEKVEEKEQFETCLQLGYSFFQGYYFAKPAVLSGKKLPPTQRALIQLLAMLNADADTQDVAKAIKADVALCYNLLRLVNAASVGLPRRIDTVSQALLVLGRAQLQRWLQVMLYAEHGEQRRGLPPLLMLATTRGRLLELIAREVDPRNHALSEAAFTVGIMSLMDTLFGIPMEEILDQLAVSDKIGIALLYRSGQFGEMLKLAEQLERAEETDTALESAASKFELNLMQLREIQLTAFEWGDQVARAVK